MTVPPQPPQPQHFGPGHGGGWPGNELEEALAASVQVPGAGARLLEVLGRSSVWVPLPEGGGRESRDLDLPTIELDGAAYVPVFSSEEQFLSVAGGHMSFTIAPAREFARGLPPQVGIAVNPEGTVGVPLPPEAVAELCKNTAAEQAVAGVARGARVRLYEPDWQDDPVTFLSAASSEFGALPFVRTARRALASAEGDPPALFVGLELDMLEPESRQAAHEALGRALHAAEVRWPVQMVLLDAARDPVVEWMRQCVRPFYARPGHD
ncbi:MULTISPECIES: enhanced serine sensitivity protein SseB [unclassified Streptomyces]|uniref:enhanced serine sensitivity protein SseB n=1 Tax=unclassified Streptomyces TaxID=2593676 RepID=UPI002DDA6F6B|nr:MULTISPECIES: enhanced serine sensitivity protein SseB [unclassified Streptomyces]WSA92224.1 enhanced serine sensitivity protein SseB [Streptomyces sp. NBC_01795]WSB76590.1 enhanced serine sensitivity protein SseB [Streptomyces sp. NBC_01775]WSS15123.1 enhanced serine sensitivity protein SseB [Streptomyces sp. NBC_01186]WSS43966.1 enhanced serine sensitivity protein SseB [Streptomyces sp. NBC_01187]